MTQAPPPRILVVDDEANIRHVLGLILRGEGYTVDEAEDGREALKALLAREYQIVLCDIRMPRLDGLELLKALDDRGVQTTVIVMSAYGHLDTAVEAIQAGAYDYIAKPFKADDVLMSVRKAEERRKLRRHKAALAHARGAIDGIIAESPAMKAVMKTVRKVASYPSTVLLSGESGTGKELVARALHEQSGRQGRPLISVNCGAIPENLLESELFGHVKGAFTDATRDKRGLFEEADGGTLFLDEIAELPLSLQVKLLRVLQESEVRPVGSTRSRKVNVRVIAASHRALAEEVGAGRFRQDLYYRLNVLPITLPPLRGRPEDVPVLVNHFIKENNQALGTRVRGIAPRAMQALLAYGWPGNVRELQNVIERAMVLTETEVIELESLPEHMRDLRNPVYEVLEDDDLSIKKATAHIERTLIRRALERTGGNRTHAAKLLEISHRALLYKLKSYFPDGGV